MTARATSLTLLVNPVAGGGRARRAAPAVIGALRSAGWQVRVHVTEGLADAERVAAQAEPGTVISVLSGDGVIAAAAAGVLHSGTVLAPLPGGRGNDYCRALAIPTDPVDAARALTAARVVRLDVGLVGDRVFLGVASCGFDSEANRIANAARLARGQLVYAYAALRTLAAGRRSSFTVTSEQGDPLQFTGWTVAVGNAGRYGGGMRICPDATMTDGLLDVVTVGDVGRLDFLRTLPKVFTGRHLEHPAVSMHRAATVHITADRDLVIYADGDPIGTLPVTITTRAACLPVLAHLPVSA